MNPIILTTLGTGNYHQATYQWGIREPVETKLVSAALKVWIPTATVMALITAEAKEKNGSFLKELIPSFIPIDISKGASDEENWGQFGAIVAAIPEGSTVYMDVTHGFRSLPIVTLLAIAYLRSVRSVTLAGVLYGAFEPNQPPEKITPVFDLTPFVSLLDWASSAERFIETGDARKITALLEKQNDLEDLASPLGQLSSALAFQRPLEASRAAQKVRQEIKKVKKRVLRSDQQQFALTLDHIEQRFKGIAHGSDAHDNDPERVLKGQYSQIQFYMSGGQYAQAIELTREWLLSVQLWKADRSNIWDSGTRSEKSISSLPSIALKVEWAEYYVLWKQSLPLRNRFAHFNDTKQLSSEDGVREISDIQALIAALPAAVLPLGLNLEEKPKP